MIGHEDMNGIIATEAAEAAAGSLQPVVTAHARAEAIIKDMLVNHLPRIIEGLNAGYVDENQILVLYDHAVRARILKEHASGN